MSSLAAKLRSPFLYLQFSCGKIVLLCNQAIILALVVLVEGSDLQNRRMSPVLTFSPNLDMRRRAVLIRCNILRTDCNCILAILFVKPSTHAGKSGKVKNLLSSLSLVCKAPASEH